MRARELDPDVLAVATAEIKKATQFVAQNLDIGIQLGRLRQGRFSAVLEIEISSAPGMTPEAEAYIEAASTRPEAGLRTEWLWEVFEALNGDDLQVVGYQRRNWRYPVLVRRVSDGVVFRYKAREVANRMCARVARDLRAGKATTQAKGATAQEDSQGS